jgi:hypothetical protein
MKVGFTGSHGTGKTKVSNYLKGHPEFEDFYFPPSSARTLNLPVNESATALSQLLIAVDRANCFDSDPDVVSDRTVLDSWAYNKYLINNGLISPGMAYELLFDEFVFYQMKNIDLLVYFPIYWPVEDDGFRPTDEHFRQEVDQWISEGLEKFCPYHEVLVMENEGVIERANKIIAQLDLLDD